MACQEGAADVLVAYPMVGANARRVRKIAHQFLRARPAPGSAMQSISISIPAPRLAAQSDQRTGERVKLLLR
jgi:D-serine deaminase-like pyridoxal phosphate-dependent protein